MTIDKAAKHWLRLIIRDLSDICTCYDDGFTESEIKSILDQIKKHIRISMQIYP